MDKEFIISEIQRTAENGKALGAIRFTAETGIKTNDWHGKYWARWSDAIAEAGFSPNKLTTASEEKTVLEAVLRLARQLARFPSKGEYNLSRRTDPSLPSYDTLSRLDSRSELKHKLLTFCYQQNGFADLEPIVLSMSAKERVTENTHEEPAVIASGYVYLVSAQEAFKIGSTRAPYRRIAEIANQSAKGAELLHLIPTDDPEGIEKYWHRRFDDKRITGLNKQSGEWFALSSDDIRAFKRRKTM